MAAADQPASPHHPVLYQETIEALRPQSGERYVDGTVGAGGHAAGILAASAPDGRLLALDVDPEAVAIAEKRLQDFGTRVRVRRASYGDLTAVLREESWSTVDGILLDLGASSMQFDRPERGFSFSQDGPLDMRFDPQNPLTAAELVNEWDERELADVIYRYGEERRSRRVAKAIVGARPLESSAQLAQVVSRAVGGKRNGVHPATRTFQALRIAVNAELETLEAALPQAIEAMKSGGRLAVIAFHSLEDRIVKRFLRRESRDCICPPEQAVCTCGHKATIKEIVRRPIRPTKSEVQRNPRARSARLRVAEKL